MIIEESEFIHLHESFLPLLESTALIARSLLTTPSFSLSHCYVLAQLLGEQMQHWLYFFLLISYYGPYACFRDPSFWLSIFSKFSFKSIPTFHLEDILTQMLTPLYYHCNSEIFYRFTETSCPSYHLFAIGFISIGSALSSLFHSCAYCFHRNGRSFSTIQYSTQDRGKSHAVVTFWLLSHDYHFRTEWKHICPEIVTKLLWGRSCIFHIF